jgi:hypothetical protein
MGRAAAQGGGKNLGTKIMITKTDLPPLPWSYSTNAPIGTHDGKGFVYLLDANGRKIGTVWGRPQEKLAIAELICDVSEEASRWK